MLFKALSCFALRDIDLTKIERWASARAVSLVQPRVAHAPSVVLHSRPMRSNPISVVDPDDDRNGGRVLRFGYLFYVDLVASTADVNTQNALRHLQARPCCGQHVIRKYKPLMFPHKRNRKWRRSCACWAATRWTTVDATRRKRRAC